MKKKLLLVFLAIVTISPAYSDDVRNSGGFNLNTDEGEKISAIVLEDATPRILSDGEKDSVVVFNGMRINVLGKPESPNDDTKWFIVKTEKGRVLMCRTDDHSTIIKPWCWTVKEGQDLILSMGGS